MINKLSLLSVVSLLGMIFFAGCLVDFTENIPCDLNRDCPRNFSCDSDTGTCVLVGAPQCYSAEDCPSDIPFCFYGFCSVECREDRDCGGNQICHKKRCMDPRPGLESE